MRQFAGRSADEGKAAAALCLTATTTLEQIGNYNNTEMYTYIFNFNVRESSYIICASQPFVWIRSRVIWVRKARRKKKWFPVVIPRAFFLFPLFVCFFSFIYLRRTLFGINVMVDTINHSNPFNNVCEVTYREGIETRLHPLWKKQYTGHYNHEIERSASD